MARTGKPLGDEMSFIVAAPFFFFPVGIVYGFVSNWEPIGTITICCLGGMFAFIGGYLWLLSRRIDLRPSDREDGDIVEAAGDYGEFEPHSWWPFIAGLAATVLTAGLAIGWWLIGIGAVFSIYAVVGYAFENNRGIRAH